MQRRTALITGASDGIGAQAARQLVQDGWQVAVIGRNPVKTRRLADELKAPAYLADFAVLDQVQRLAAELGRDFPRIDLLCNNAGGMFKRQPPTADGFEMTFQVNHLAPFLLTALLLGPLGRARQARVIQVNSEGHRFGGLNLQDLDWKRRPYIGLRAYGASKIAQIAAVKELAGRLNSTGITVNAMHPGGVRTGIGSNNGPLYRAWMRLVIRHFLKDPAISGDALYYLSAAPELAGTSGEYFHLTLEAKPLQRALDQQLRAAVWERTLPLCGLSPEFLQNAVGSQLAGEDGNGQA